MGGIVPAKLLRPKTMAKWKAMSEFMLGKGSNSAENPHLSLAGQIRETNPRDKSWTGES
jgi:hypothetical protein